MSRIHIFGASGSGTTTLGKELSQCLEEALSIDAAANIVKERMK